MTRRRLVVVAQSLDADLDLNQDVKRLQRSRVFFPPPGSRIFSYASPFFQLFMIGW